MGWIGLIIHVYCNFMIRGITLLEMGIIGIIGISLALGFQWE